MSCLSRLLTSRLRNEDGQMIVLVGLMSVILTAIVGIAVDVGRLYVTKAELSRAVDAAALSGILEFNGQSSGLTAGENKAEAYFDENEPGPDTTRNATAIGATNEMTMDASKSVDMIFLGLLGLGPVTVNAHAKAGFGTLTVDAALAIDSTSSMADTCNGSQNNTGCPIWEAKNAAKAFKDILLGSSPSGNVAVGVAAWRGCYRRPTPTTTAPKPNSSSNCVLHDGTGSSQVSELISNSATLTSMINNISAIGGSGTNVCGGLAKGWEVLNGPGNHQTEENNRSYLILLSDGDNNYNGAYSYQTSPASPHTYQTHSCMPPSSCANVGGESSSGTDPCHNGVNMSTTVSNVTEGFESNNFSGGTNWAGNWAVTAGGGDTPTIINTDSPQAGSRHLRVRATSNAKRQFSLSGYASANLSYYAKTTLLEAGDNFLVQVSCDNSTWTDVRDHATNVGYTQYPTYALPCIGDSSVWIRILGSAGDASDNFFIDSITIARNNPPFEDPADGYLNGAVPSPSCSSTPVKRERQLDLKTIEMADAIKAASVEIFVVAFGLCSDATTVCGDDICSDAECDAQIGNTDNDNIGDQRLMKCIASSNVNTSDHYYYATSASQLGTIFTSIANQIAHRLIE